MRAQFLFAVLMFLCWSAYLYAETNGHIVAEVPKTEIKCVGGKELFITTYKDSVSVVLNMEPSGGLTKIPLPVKCNE